MIMPFILVKKINYGSLLNYNYVQLCTNTKKDCV